MLVHKLSAAIKKTCRTFGEERQTFAGIPREGAPRWYSISFPSASLHICTQQKRKKAYKRKHKIDTEST